MKFRFLNLIICWIKIILFFVIFHESMFRSHINILRTHSMSINKLLRFSMHQAEWLMMKQREMLEVF